MRRLFTLLLLAMLPLQLSWATVATYCQHETQGAGHFGHHEHEHHTDAGSDTGLVPGADADADADADTLGDKAPGAADFDCGHCHGQCSVITTLAAKLPGRLATAPPGAASHQAGDAHASPRPERPQWQHLA